MIDNTPNTAQIKVYPDLLAGAVNPWIYGQFLEHINHSVDLGLHAEMLTERSFEREGVHQPAFMWDEVNKENDEIRFSLTNINPFNSEKCLQMVIKTDLRHACGIRQSCIAVKAGEVLRGYLYLRAFDTYGTIEVGVRERNGGKVYASFIIDELKPYWQKHCFTLTPSESDNNAEFYIVSRHAGTYYLDQVSLMPEAYLSMLPLRKDLFEACKCLRPTIIRWPGGCFASGYNWKDGIGSIDHRRAHMTYDWGDGAETDPYTFGTDEFIAFCRELGAEPLIVLNISRGLQDAFDWIEYCNGDISTEWGSKRAKNGHPEPYNVTCWSIDNEMWDMGSKRYIQAAGEFCDAIRSRYKNYKIWVVGTGQPFEQLDNPESRAYFGPKVIAALGDCVDFSSYHYYYESDYKDYEMLMVSNLDLEILFNDEINMFNRNSRNNSVKLAFDEWNPGGTDYKSGLASALILNTMERMSDKVAMATPALWLRNERLSSTWDNALINHDHTGWYPSVTYLAMKLWSMYKASDLVRTEIHCPDYQGIRLERCEGKLVKKDSLIPMLDVVASSDSKKGYIIIKIVNRSLMEDISCSISLVGTKTGICRTVECHTLYHDKIDAKNTMENPDNIKIVETSINIQGSSNCFNFISRKHSASVLVIKENMLLPI